MLTSKNLQMQGMRTRVPVFMEYEVKPSSAQRFANLPVLVMIISVLRAWNFCHSSLLSNSTRILLLAATGVVGAGAEMGGEGRETGGSWILGPSIERSRFRNIAPEIGIMLGGDWETSERNLIGVVWVRLVFLPAPWPKLTDWVFGTEVVNREQGVIVYLRKTTLVGADCLFYRS